MTARNKRGRWPGRRARPCGPDASGPIHARDNEVAIRLGRIVATARFPGWQIISNASQQGPGFVAFKAGGEGGRALVKAGSWPLSPDAEEEDVRRAIRAAVASIEGEEAATDLRFLAPK